MTDHERLISAIKSGAYCWFSTHELWYSAYEMLVDMGWRPSTFGKRVLQLGVSHVDTNETVGNTNVTVKNGRDQLLACTYSLDFLKSAIDGDYIEEFYDESFLHPVCIEVDTKGLLEAVFDEVPA